MADDVKPGADQNESWWAKGKRKLGEVRTSIKENTGFDAANLLANPMGVGLLAMDKVISDSGAKPGAAASGVRIPGMTPEKATEEMAKAGNQKLQGLGVQARDAVTSTVGAVNGAVAAGVEAGGQAAREVVGALKNAVGIVPEELKDTRRHDLSGLDLGEGAGGSGTKAVELGGDSGGGTVTVAPGAGTATTAPAAPAAPAAPKLSAKEQAVQEVQRFGERLEGHMPGKSKASILKAAFDEVRRDYEVRKLRADRTGAALSAEDTEKLKALEEIARDKKGMAATLATPVAAPAPVAP